MNDFLDTPIADIMTTRIEMVADTIPLSYAAKLLVEKQITGLPVTTELGELVGVLSWADVMRALRDEDHAEDAIRDSKGAYYAEGEAMVWDGGTSLEDVQAKVGDYMSDLIIAVGVDATVRDAVRLMKKGKVHRVLVVDDQGSLAGLVSATDIVYLVADGLDDD
ncbi:MAG TPA: CBS domain-containing protein [Polyangiaceae bacterium]|nr:CBS domain-containing protein [Polyangiaceae bacterium]